MSSGTGRQAAETTLAAETNLDDGVMRLAHSDWLHHRLTLCAAPDDLAAFRAAARGAGIIPWRLDLDRLEEDWFLRLAAPIVPPALRLSAAGARMLAAQLREAVSRRHAIAVSAVGVAETCPFDLHALVPVPDEILGLEPDDPRAQTWLWAHWGTTAALRHVTDITPETDRVGRARAVLSFWSADWTPWRALARLADRWPGVRFDIRPDYGPPMTGRDGAAEPTPEAWEDPYHRIAGAGTSAPILSVEGFEGPLDWLLEMVRAHKIDLARLPILALVTGFSTALETALAGRDHATPLGPWGDWLVMAANLALLRSRLLLPADGADAQQAADEADLLRRQLVSRAEIRAAVDWLERRPAAASGGLFREGAAKPRCRKGGSVISSRCCEPVSRPSGCRTAREPYRPAPAARLAASATRSRASSASSVCVPEEGCPLAAFLPPIAAAEPEREPWSRVAIAHHLSGGAGARARGTGRARSAAAPGPPFSCIARRAVQGATTTVLIDLGFLCRRPLRQHDAPAFSEGRRSRWPPSEG